MKLEGNSRKPALQDLFLINSININNCIMTVTGTWLAYTFSACLLGIQHSGQSRDKGVCITETRSSLDVEYLALKCIPISF